MADSNTADVNATNVDTDNLDDFSATFFGNKPAEVKEDEEISETPSATPKPETVEEEESTPEGEDGKDAPAAEEEDNEEDEPEEAPKPRGRKPARERINDLTRQRRDLERELEASRFEIERLRGKVVPEDTPVRQSATKSPETAPLDKDAPHPDTTLEDGSLKYPLGEFDPSYISDLTRFTIRQENEVWKRSQEESQRAAEMQKAEKELIDNWTDKVKSVSDRIPDLSEKASGLEDTFVSIDPNYGQFIAATIMSLEYGPDVLNYLAENPEEARSIIDSGPTKATIALGRLEARFIAGEEVEKGKVIPTQAPPPPPRTKGSSGKTGVAADTDDLDAFEKSFFVKRR